MTKDYFIQLADYNIWANKIVRSWLEKISDEQWDQTIVSSFNSIATTVLHVAGAETIWLDRLNEIKNPILLATTFKGSRTELLTKWEKTSEELKDFLVQFDESKMQTPLTYKRLNGVEYVQPFYQLFAHIFNHTTYHRGQLVTMLRQAGFEEVGQTDMIVYFR